METNALYFGDNLKVLSERNADGSFRFPSDSVDLVYLDPPFNSNRDYNLIFKETSGTEADAQIKAFEDTWHWDATARDTFEDLTVAGVNEGRVPDQVGRMIEALVRGIGHNDMSAYLVMMAPRLVQLHRVLKPTGSLWLHCDPTASHYLKVLLDAIFGAENFANEIVWKRTTAHSDSKRAGRIHDVLLYYGKPGVRTWNPVYQPYDEQYVERYYRYKDPDGRRYASGDVAAAGPGPARIFNGVLREPPPGSHWRYSQEKIDQYVEQGRIFFTANGFPRFKRYLDEMEGTPLQDIWADKAVQPVVSWSKEGLGWATQKPLGLMERIIAASSNEGDIVLDPFCGCGTALIAAHKLKRKWVGIDVTHLSIAVMRARLRDSFGLADVPIHGVPADLPSARMLAEQSKDGRYEFQWWAIEQIAAHPVGGEKKKGADRGIDGLLTFTERDAIQRILVSVKSGKPSLGHVKELLATLTTEKGAIGVLIELDEPTPEMKRAAVEAGQYESELWGGKYDRIQILTVADLLAGKKPVVPKYLPGYQKAEKISTDLGEQQVLDLGKG